MSDPDRLVRIETKLDVALETVREHAKRIRTLELIVAGSLATSGVVAIVVNGLP